MLNELQDSTKQKLQAFWTEPSVPNAGSHFAAAQKRHEMHYSKGAVLTWQPIVPCQCVVQSRFEHAGEAYYVCEFKRGTGPNMFEVVDYVANVKECDLKKNVWELRGQI